MTRKHSEGAASSLLTSLSKSVPLLAALGLSLAGCGGLGGISDVTTMFDKPPERLPGKRVSVLKAGENKGAIASAEMGGPVVLPPPFTNASWSQPGGAPTNAPGHLAFSGGLHTLWSASAGEGSSKRMRLTAIPLVYDNKVFTLDAEGAARAVSAASGDTIWKVSLLPQDEQAGGFNLARLNPWSAGKGRAGFGGGLAADGGKLFAATGFGTVVALDPGSGKPIWTKKMEIPIRQAPAAADGRLYIVNSESQIFCLSEADGSELWTQSGLPANASLLSNGSPAVGGNLVFVPYPSGEVAALDVRNGQSKWTEMLGQGDLSSSATAIGDAARPVVDRELVFAMSRGGKLIATSREKGERLWSREVSGSQMPWVAGDTLFVVDVTGKLVALNRKDGKVRWLTQLPGEGLWSGPVLGGGKLWLASSKGQLVGVDATSGAIANQHDVGAPVLVTPVVAEGRLFVLTDKAKLIAMN